MYKQAMISPGDHSLSSGSSNEEEPTAEGDLFFCFIFSLKFCVPFVYLFIIFILQYSNSVTLDFWRRSRLLSVLYFKNIFHSYPFSDFLILNLKLWFFF